MASKIDLFLDVMFHSADQTHLWHLQTKSDPLHRTLNKYYDQLRDETDRFAEACMGYKGVQMTAVGKMPLKALKKESQVTEHLIMVCKFCNQLYDEVATEEGSQHLLAIIDDIRELIATTKYLVTLN